VCGSLANSTIRSFKYEEEEILSLLLFWHVRRESKCFTFGFRENRKAKDMAMKRRKMLLRTTHLSMANLPLPATVSALLMVFVWFSFKNYLHVICYFTISICAVVQFYHVIISFISFYDISYACPFDRCILAG
jgi:hypothetical protein